MSYEFKHNTVQWKNMAAKETLEEVLSYPFRGSKQRGVTKHTCELFGVRAKVEDNEPVAFYFPSHDQKGNVVGYAKQDLTKSKDEKYHWTTVGNVKIGNKLFGQVVAESNARKKVNIITTEGQWDCLSVYQSIIDETKGTKYEDLKPFVVSIPMGTANAVESLMQNKDFVTSFDELTVFFDNDEATKVELKKGVKKGKEAKQDVASAFLSEMKLFEVVADGDYKDASDYLQDGKYKELAKLVQWDRKSFASENIVHVGDIDFDELIKPIPKGVEIKSFPKLNDLTYGLRTGELTIVTSTSGAGKTTCITKIGEDIIDAGERLGVIYLEERNKKTLQRFVASQLKVSYNKFKMNPLSVATVDQIRSVYDSLAKENKIVMLDHFGSMPISSLISKVKHLYFVEGCRYIILDHLSMVISGSEVTDERKELDIVMTELAAFCAANDVSILLVVHLNRQGSSDNKKPKDDQKDEPYWNRITKETMRGSAGLEQMSWNIWALESEILPNRKRGRVRWVSLKAREFGELGIADVFSIDTDTWEVEHFEDGIDF